MTPPVYILGGLTSSAVCLQERAGAMLLLRLPQRLPLQAETVEALPLLQRQLLHHRKVGASPADVKRPQHRCAGADVCVAAVRV